MSLSKIAFIGAGNMAQAIFNGLIKEGMDADRILATGTNVERLTALARTTGVTVTTDNGAAVQAASIVVLSVKPQMLKAVCLELAAHLSHQPLIISVAAGITIESLTRWLGRSHSIVRAMPNTPAQLGLGATGAFANAKVTSGEKSHADAILTAVGQVAWLDDEALINPVTAVSGSGPAYFYRVMEAMINEGVRMGLTPEIAKQLTLQTALGAATLASQSEIDVAELRRRVTSPKGTTEQALLSFERDDIDGMFARAMQACAARGESLAKELDE